jgi:8-oxo-dGTP diphosphatase
MPYKLATLIYCIKDEKVLMLKRVKPPYPGYWIAPGGKLERGEGPLECALRELREETGLVAATAQLRALVTESSSRDDWQWLLFVYRAETPRGKILKNGPEGELRWFEAEELEAAQIPPADRYFMRDALRSTPGTVEYRFAYDDELELVGNGPALFHPHFAPDDD